MKSLGNGYESLYSEHFIPTSLSITSHNTIVYNKKSNSCGLLFSEKNDTRNSYIESVKNPFILVNSFIYKWIQNLLFLEDS